MNLRRIKHTLLRLSAEEKVIGIGALLVIVSAFMPWYSVVMNFDNKIITETGFSGDLGVIGFVIFLMSLFAMAFLVSENLHLPLPQFGHKKEKILFFFMGQSTFLTLLTLTVYVKRSLDFTDAGPRFGIYLALLGAFFGAASALALIQKDRKREVQEFFSHEEAMEEQPQASEPVREEVREEPQEEVQEEPMLFEEDRPDIKEEVQDFAEYVPEDDMLEDVKEVDQEHPENQGDYFTREAGVEAEESPKKGGGAPGSFYEDQ